MSRKYLELSKKINEEILMRFQSDSYRLPSEVELAQKYEVSRETVRRALNQLIEQGKIYSIQGSGYYVKKEQIVLRNSLNKLSSITEMIRDAYLMEGDMVVKMSPETSNEQVSRLLTISENDFVYVIDRIRTAREEPVVFSRNIIPLKLVGAEFASRYKLGSLSAFLKEEYEIEMTDAVAEIQAVTDMDPIPEIFKRPGYSLLKFIQVHYSIEGEPILLSYDYMRNDVIRFFVKRTKNGSF